MAVESGCDYSLWILFIALTFWLLATWLQLYFQAGIDKVEVDRMRLFLECMGRFGRESSGNCEKWFRMTS